MAISIASISTIVMDNTQNEMEKTYSYINSEGNVVSVKTLNNYHLVNALIKNVTTNTQMSAPESETNIKLLKEEILERLATTPM